jgi:hypothetical protein
LPSTTRQSSFMVLSRWVLLAHRAMISLSHSLKILVLGLGSSLSLGTRSPRIVGPWWWRHPSREFHLYSLLRNKYLGEAHHILSSVEASPWELNHPNSLRLPIGMSPGQPWAPLPNAWF